MVKKIGWAYERNFSPNSYRQSRNERNTYTIHITMAGAVLVDSKKIIVGRKEKRLQNESFCSRLSLRPSTQILESTN